MTRNPPPEAAELLSVALTSAGLEQVLSQLTGRCGDLPKIRGLPIVNPDTKRATR